MKFEYPWRDGHRLALHVDGGEFFPAMLDAIGGAEESVALVIYQVASGKCADRWIDALAAAARRGLDVYVLADRFGAFPARSELDALTDAGVRLAWFNPPRLFRPLVNLFRDHRKLLVIDGRVGFIGGYCLTDEFDPKCTDRPWHDMAIEVEGPTVADMLSELERDWDTYGEGDVAIVAKDAKPGTARTRLVRHHPRRRRDIRRAAHERMQTARERLWFVTPYFAPTRRMRRALRRAARRGVDVRLLLSGPITDHPTVRTAGWRHYGRLLRAGARIFEYQDRALHMKAVLVDDWVCAGSCNFDHWGMRWNRDANLETDAQDLVRAFATMLSHDFSASDEITLAEHRARPLFDRVRQWFGSFVDLWIVRSAYRSQLRATRAHADDETD